MRIPKSVTTWRRAVLPLTLIFLLLPLLFTRKQQACDSVITVTEFSDFQCPYCKRAAGVVEQLRQSYGDKVKLVFKQMPLPMHQDAFKAAQASVCAQEQGKFWEYHDRLFATSDLSGDALNRIAAEVGLNPHEFSQCLESQTSRAIVENDMAEAERLGVSGTPTFFVNGQLMKGPASFSALKGQVDQEIVRRNHAPASKIFQLEPSIHTPPNIGDAIAPLRPSNNGGNVITSQTACTPFPTPTVAACTAADGGLATDFLSLYPSNPLLAANCSAQFSVLLGPAAQQCNFTSRVQQWTSSNPSVATIDAAGHALALSGGTTTITATEFIGTSSVQTSTTLTVFGAPTPSPTPTPMPAPPITLSQTAIDFGYQLVGTISPQTTETVINSGTTPLVITDISVSGRDRRDFTPSYNFSLPMTIAPGNNVSIKLTFTPALPWRAGKRDARMEIDQKKSSWYVYLSGIGASCGGPLPGCSSGCADADGDGLNDAWETAGGVDLNNDGRIAAQNDLLLSESESNKPDIFVWYDWMDYGGDDQSCATSNDCYSLGTYHAGETCNSEGQCIYSCASDFDCTSRSPTAAHAGERCVSNICEHTHDPLVLDANAFQPVVEQFAAHGINLHILRGNAQPHSHVVSLRRNAQMTSSCEGATVAAGTAGLGKYAESLYELKTRSSPDTLNLAYHYALFAHYSGCDSSAHCTANAGNSSNCPNTTLAYGQSGLAELSGNDLIISLGGLVNDSGVSPHYQISATFMHELGHNLGLRHNGHRDKPCPGGGGCPAGDTCSDTGDGQGHVCHALVDESNYKPNYLSVMNYMYEGSGILVADGVGSLTPRRCSTDADCGGRGALCLGGCVRLDYSDQTLPTGGPTPGALDESCLDDTLGLGSGTADIFKYMDGSCHTCPHFAPTTGPVDWKGAGLVTNNTCAFIGTPTYTFTDTCVSADIDQIDSSLCDPAASEILHGYTDWPDLSGILFNYRFQCTPHGGN